MADRLTDKTVLATVPADTDVGHVVDVSDTTANAAGTSKQVTEKTRMGKGLSTVQSCYVLARTAGTTSMSALGAGDVIMYVDADEMIIGQVLAAVTTIPTDLRDETKFRRFLDLSPLL